MKDSGQHCTCHNGYLFEGHCAVCGLWDAPRVKVEPFKYVPDTKLPETEWSKLPWNGEGLPPVGTECHIQVGTVYSGECIIKYVSDSVVVYQHAGGEYTANVKGSVSFKPLIDEEDHLVLEAIDCVNEAHYPNKTDDVCRDLIKAGYRKHASLNRDFSTGDTYNTDINHWKAGIHTPGHMNAIECYAGTQEGAELLRDEILERLSC